MNLKLRLISTCTAVLLTAGVSGQCLALSTPFTDLGGTGAKEYILTLQEKGIVQGVGEGLFAPDRLMTAAEGVQLLVNTLDLNLDTIRFVKEPKATDYFSKADDNAWYAKALITAAVNGLDLPADLDPAQVWSRQELIYRLIGAMEMTGKAPMIIQLYREIADEDQIDEAYRGAVQRALTYGVVQLDEDGNFHPQDPVTRAEAAQQAYLALACMETYSEPATDESGLR